MFHIQILWSWVRAQADASSSRIQHERGATALEWVLIAAGAAGIALAAVLIIKNKVLGKANSIPTG